MVSSRLKRLGVLALVVVAVSLLGNLVAVLLIDNPDAQQSARSARSGPDTNAVPWSPILRNHPTASGALPSVGYYGCVTEDGVPSCRFRRSSLVAGVGCEGTGGATNDQVAVLDRVQLLSCIGAHPDGLPGTVAVRLSGPAGDAGLEVREEHAVGVLAQRADELQVLGHSNLALAIDGRINGTSPRATPLQPPKMFADAMVRELAALPEDALFRAATLAQRFGMSDLLIVSPATACFGIAPMVPSPELHFGTVSEVCQPVVDGSVVEHSADKRVLIWLRVGGPIADIAPLLARSAPQPHPGLAVMVLLDSVMSIRETLLGEVVSVAREHRLTVVANGDTVAILAKTPADYVIPAPLDFVDNGAHIVLLPNKKRLKRTNWVGPFCPITYEWAQILMAPDGACTKVHLDCSASVPCAFLRPVEACIPGEFPGHVTKDFRTMPLAQAVLVSLPQLTDWRELGYDRLPPRRASGQVWVAELVQESAEMYPMAVEPSLLSLFDLTIGHHPHMDIVFQHFASEPTDQELRQEPIPLSQRTGKNLVAAFISNCEALTKRVPYMEQLNRTVLVDSYGKCRHSADLPENQENADARDNNVAAARFLQSGRNNKRNTIANHKFYLAFENSRSPGYVSEKVFDALIAGAIPIYYGSSTYRKFLPCSDCTLSVDDFANPKALADEVARIAADDKLYAKYLEWKTRPFRPEFLELRKVAGPGGSRLYPIIAAAAAGPSHLQQLKATRGVSWSGGDVE